MIAMLRHFILALFISTSLLAAKPNILFLFADDHTYEAVRAFGHTDIDTPNLDRLAARARRSRVLTTWARGAVRCAWPAARC
jgi:hypothetical protein